MADDPQKTWDDYYSRKKTERVREADAMWKTLASAGINEDSVLALDFVHFAADRDAVESLSSQLSENYVMEISPGSDGYWLAKGTTRPYGLTLSQSEHFAWVNFMCVVAQSYGCVFSTWALEVPSLGIVVKSEDQE